LVRHGLTPKTGQILPGRASGLHLADEGRRQADAVAQRIAKLPSVAAIYTSPLERARETAAAIARARRLTLAVERDLTECDTGEWTGLRLKRAQRKPEWQLVRRHPSGFRFPGGESFTEMQARVTGALARLVERHPGKTIVAVSHADPIKATVAHALGLHLDLFQRIAIAPCSITAIAYRPEAPLVLTVNSLNGDLGWLQTRRGKRRSSAHPRLRRGYPAGATLSGDGSEGAGPR
jgi:probable phosphoglycerate mutase